MKSSMVLKDHVLHALLVWTLLTMGVIAFWVWTSSHAGALRIWKLLHC